ncbi:MAG TPA: nuclease-related domain-containing protein [Acidimicrobiales bacterium]|nr:nuclease-related domain-containing protein [Acidimicrobiales bacterium]
MSTAGGSARREYQRRRAKDRERRRANFKVAFPLVVLTPFVVYGFVVFVAVPQINRAFGRGIDNLAQSPAPTRAPAVDDEAARWIGLVLALGATLRMGREAWGARATTEAWRKGSEGEVRTGNTLDRLRDRGYVVLHDRKIPGSRANIDHALVGPTGVAIVENKHYTGRVVIDRDAVRYNGRSMEAAIDEAWREAAAVEDVLRTELAARGLRVRPIICVQGASIEVRGWRSSAVVHGVRFCSGRRLRDAVTEGRCVLDPAAIAAMSALLESRLPPASK